jgi:hypothetical protein
MSCSKGFGNWIHDNMLMVHPSGPERSEAGISVWRLTKRGTRISKQSQRDDDLVTTRGEESDVR